MPQPIDVVKHVLSAHTMHHHFQPIWRSDTKSLLGFEALARFDDYSPDIVFRAAEDAHLGIHLDRLSIQEALKSAQSLPGLLFVNINPNHLDQSQGPFGSVGQAIATYRSRRAVVLEITEEKVLHQGAADAGITRMQRRGIRLALDDAGTGNSDVVRLTWIRPSFVKIAQSIIEQWQAGHTAPLIRWIRLAEDLGADVIAEGIEDPALIQPLTDLGVLYIQGYALGYPEPIEYWNQKLLTTELTLLERAVNHFSPPHWPRSRKSPSPLLSVTEIGDIMYSMWPFPAVIVDHNNLMVGMNLRAERHFGTSLEQVAEMPAEEVLGLSSGDPTMTRTSLWLPGDLAVGEIVEQPVILHQTGGQNLPAHMTIVGIRIGHRPQLYKLIAIVPELSGIDLPANSGRDPLTGLPTRIWWEREAALWANSEGSVIFLDLDGLKQVNDLFGHQEGDRLLADVGRAIHHLIETEDMQAIRYGGDEFLVVLKNRTTDEAEEIAKKLSYALSQFDVDGSRIPTSFSYGVARFATHQLDHAIAEADRRLYEQKGLLLRTP